MRPSKFLVRTAAPTGRLGISSGIGLLGSYTRRQSCSCRFLPAANVPAMRNHQRWNCRRVFQSVLRLAACAAVMAALAASSSAGELQFRVQEIDDSLDVGYAVQLIDMNGDKKLDIVVVDSERLVWYENPTWKAHTFLQGKTKADNVCFAPLDIDGDGRLDFAVGADWRPSDTVSSGTLQWVSPGKKPGDEWTVHPIEQVPTIHRMCWADFDADGKPELIVVPLFGRGATRRENFMDQPLKILSYKVPADPVRDPWKAEVINQDLHVAHNFYPADVDGDGRLDMLVASYEGVSLLKRS